MSAESREFTPKQLQAQRIFLRESRDESQPGDGLKRFGWNAGILLGATATDLAESHLADLIREPMKEKKIEARNAYYEKFDSTEYKAAKELLKTEADNEAAKTYVTLIDSLATTAKVKTGLHDAVEFAEEWASDGVYAGLANAWIRNMTGVDKAKYVSETSAFIADWSNNINQVFFEDKYFPTSNVVKEGEHAGDPLRGIFGIKKAYKSMDFINPVNIEAAFRVMEEIPVLGDGVAWLHEKTNKLIETTIGQKANTLVAKGLLGYHIGRNARGL